MIEQLRLGQEQTARAVELLTQRFAADHTATPTPATLAGVQLALLGARGADVTFRSRDGAAAVLACEEFTALASVVDEGDVVRALTPALWRCFVGDGATRRCLVNSEKLPWLRAGVGAAMKPDLWLGPHWLVDLKVANAADFIGNVSTPRLLFGVPQGSAMWRRLMMLVEAKTNATNTGVGELIQYLEIVCETERTAYGVLVDKEGFQLLVAVPGSLISRVRASWTQPARPMSRSSATSKPSPMAMH